MGKFNLATTLGSPDSDSAHQQVMALVQELGQELKSWSNRKLDFVVTPGFVTNLGREWRFVLKVPARSDYEHLLFRFHSPAAGLPVRFDFYDEQLLLARSIDEAQSMLDEFLKRPTTQTTIHNLIA